MSSAAAKPSLGIIGMGGFGRFIVEHLSPHFRLEVWDRDASLQLGDAAQTCWTSLESCASCDVVVPAVPVQNLESLMHHAAPYLAADSLWVDVSSVQVRPVELMLEHLPQTVRLAATHPMFGPQSGQHGIEGLKIVVHELRGSSRLTSFLRHTLGLQVLHMTPEEHDEQIAYIQGLTHWVARALREIRMPDLELATPAYRHLLAIEEILRQDSDELFLTIQRENAFASRARQELSRRLGELETWIEEQANDESD